MSLGIDRVPDGDLLVTVVIPNLNGRDLLPDCLASIPNRPDIEVLVVDNGSTDDSPDFAQQSGARVLRLDRNHGFAAACNKGVDAARGRFVLFLNSDVRLQHRALENLVHSAERQPEVVIWQPLILTPDDEVDSAGDLFTWPCFLLHITEPPPDGQTHSIFAAKGACMLARRESFTVLGGFFEPYFAYFEETDLCWRARMMGWEIQLVPTSRAVHIGGQTTTVIFTPHQIRHLAFRNRIRSILANASLPSLARILPLHLLGCLGAAIAFLFTARWRSALAVLAAVWWPIGHPRQMWAQRRTVQASRRVGDSALLQPDIVGRLTLRRSMRLLRGQLWRWERRRSPLR